MTRRTFRARYSEMLGRRLPGIKEVLTQFDPYKNWHRNRLPESSVTEELELALFLLYTKHSGPETKQYLMRTIEIADRVIQEKKCESRLCRWGFPRNRGDTIRTRAFAKSLSGASLDMTALIHASADFEAYCAAIGQADWDEISQADFLAAIRLAIIVGDLAQAEKLVASRRCTCTREKKEQDLWGNLLSALREGDLPLRDDALLAQFDSVFDRARNPSNATEIAALEMGLIRDFFMENLKKRICWDHVCDSISQ